MAAPSIGSMRCLLLRPCIARPLTTLSTVFARYQFRRNYAKASKKIKPLQQQVKGQAKAPLKIEKNTSILQQYVPLEEKLAQAGKQTLLYTKVHGRFLIATYSLVAGCFAFVIYNYQTGATETPPGVPAWVGKTQLVTMALVGAIGIGVAVYPTRCVFFLCI